VFVKPVAEVEAPLTAADKKRDAQLKQLGTVQVSN